MGGQLCGSSRPTLKDVLACVCACGTYATIYPFVMALNTLFDDWQRTFHTDRGTTASVQAICMGMAHGGGIIAGILERKLGQRMSMLLGIFLSTMGFFAGGFANSIPVLVMCVGVVAGFGFSMTCLSNMSRALQRFPSRAGFVSSLIVLTSGTAMVGSPFLFRYFTETYSWRGCLFLTGGLIFHSSFSSLLSTSPLLLPSKALPVSDPVPVLVSSRPKGSATLLDTPAHTTADPEGSATLLDTPAHTTDPEGSATLLGTPAHTTDTDGAPQGSSDTHAIEEPTSTREGEADKGTRSCDLELASKPAGGVPTDDASHYPDLFSDTAFAAKEGVTKGGEGNVEGEDPEVAILLRKEETGGETLGENAGGRGRKWYLLRHAPFLTSPLYLCTTLSIVFNTGMIAAFVFLVLDFAKTLQDWSLGDGLFLNSMFMACNLATRVLIMLMSLHPRFNRIVSLGAVGLIGGLAMCLVGQVSSYALAAVLFAGMGVSLGGTASLCPPSILKATGDKDFSLGLGLCFTLMGASSIACSTVAGFLVDKQGSYSLASLIYGFSILSASALLLVVFKCCKPAAAVSVDR